MKRGSAKSNSRSSTEDGLGSETKKLKVGSSSLIGEQDFSKHALLYVNHLSGNFGLTLEELIGAGLRLLSDMKIELASVSAEKYNKWASELHKTAMNLDAEDDDLKAFFIKFTERRDDEFDKANFVVFQNVPGLGDCEDNEDPGDAPGCIEGGAEDKRLTIKDPDEAETSERGQGSEPPSSGAGTTNESEPKEREGTAGPQGVVRSVEEGATVGVEEDATVGDALVLDSFSDSDPNSAPEPFFIDALEEERPTGTDVQERVAEFSDCASDEQKPDVDFIPLRKKRTGD